MVAKSKTDLKDKAAKRDREQRQRIGHLERLVAKQQTRIDRSQRIKYRLPRPAKIKKTKDFYRIVIPDTHGCFVDDKAIAAFLADLKEMSGKVREIVMLGDHLDCGGFLAEHHTIGYVAEANYSFEDDIAATNTLLDAIQEICPRVPIHYLEGNHERRIEKWCVTKAHSSKNATRGTVELLMKNFLKMFATENVLQLDKRGINYYKQGQFYNDCRIPSTIRLGKCYFTHGSRTGSSPAKAMLRDFGACVVFGHVHRSDSCIDRNVKDGEKGAWTPGCLCRLQPLWQHTQLTGWSHGYGLQLVREDESFLHVNVPIIEGRSYLNQLTGGGK